jgi:hypothetical protein
MSSDIQEIGLGGALMLAMVIIKEVVSGLLRRKNGTNGNGSSGEKSAEFWKLEIRGIVEKAIDERVVPKMTQIETALTTLIRWKGGD